MKAPKQKNRKRGISELNVLISRGKVGKRNTKVPPTIGSRFKMANFHINRALEDKLIAPIRIDIAGIFPEKKLAAVKIRVNKGVDVLKTRSLALYTKPRPFLRLYAYR